jgi:hypothetical protein
MVADGTIAQSSGSSYVLCVGSRVEVRFIILILLDVIFSASKEKHVGQLAQRCKNTTIAHPPPSLSWSYNKKQK